MENLRMEQTVTFDRPDGKTVNGYLVEPERGAGAPGIVVLQEWWGLEDQIKGVARKLASAGYRALVPDLYRGKLALDANEAKHLMDGLNFGDAASQDVRGAVQYLKRTSDKVAATGFCMGGALTILAAVHVPEVDAAVIWYGYPALEYVDAAKIEAPLLGHWALHDQAFPIDGVDKLEKMLRAANVNFTFHRYDAKHAFANEVAHTKGLAMLKYDRNAADLAWQRTLEFLAVRLDAKPSGSTKP
jgi:carboxymethylenebutenolidase